MPENAPNQSLPSPFENRQELIPPPRNREISTIIICTMMSIFAYIAYLSGNWFGFTIDLLIIAMNIGFAFFRRRTHNRLREHYEILKTLESIIETPRMKEVGHSVIFTVVFPSPEILKKLEKMRHGH